MNMIKRQSITLVLLIFLFGLLIDNDYRNNSCFGENENSLDKLVEGCQLDDVVGEHNVKMVGIWGGYLTKDQWFLRYAVQHYRTENLYIALDYYYSLFWHLPKDLFELDYYGLFPIDITDPITHKSYNYFGKPENLNDYININIKPNENIWTLNYNEISWPEGEMINASNEFMISPESKDDYKSKRMKYSNIVAAKGAILSEELNAILRDYQTRRKRMPSNSDELLDGLWNVRENWAIYNDKVNDLSNGVFIFCIDENSKNALSLWHDNFGRYYCRAYGYDYWYNCGWSNVPNAYEYASVFNSQGYEDKNYFVKLEKFENIPGIILWKCIIK